MTAAGPSRGGRGGLLDRLEPVHVAVTRDEREAVYRFRYSVYVEELGRKLGLGDRERQEVHDPEDDQPYTTLLYTGSPADMTGTIRVRHWGPGEVPEDDRRTFSMELFEGVEQLSVAEIGRLMIRPGARNRLLFVALTREAYEAAGRKGVDLGFANCVPRLVPLYRRLGLRPYAGRPVPTPDGVEVPLVLVVSDQEHFEEVGSFFAELVPRYFGPGRRPPVAPDVYRGALETAALPFVTDSEAVWEEVQRRWEVGVQAGSFLRALDPQTVRKLAAFGALLAVPAGERLTEKGLSQREMFVVLEGLFEAVDDDRRLGIAGAGDVLGEMAFFRTSGRRAASVRAVTDGRVLVLRRTFIDQLRRTDPACAADLLFHLAQVLADRAMSGDTGGRGAEMG